MNENDEETRFNPLLAILIALFGSTSWLGVNAFWVEMSVHTQTLPEGWHLGSILTIIIQISSIPALIYTLLDHKNRIKISTAPIIELALVIVAIAILLVGHFNDFTVEIGGSKRSIVVYICMFFVGSVSILSDVLFIPYMKNLPAAYFQAFFVGLGMSALMPSIFSIIQGASSYECVVVPGEAQRPPRFIAPLFTVEVFYFIVFCWYCIGLVAFILIHHKRRWIFNVWPERLTWRIGSAGYHDNKEAVATKTWNGRSDVLLLTMIAIVYSLISVLMPSIQSYVALPYSPQTYSWSLTLCAIIQPVGSFISFFAPLRKIPLMVVTCCLTVLSAMFCLTLAFQSPSPWLVGTTAGSVSVILLTMTVFGLGCYTRSVIFEYIQSSSPSPAATHRRLLYAGLVGQAGTVVGTIFVFPAVNIFNLFKSAPSC
ncbi:unnamed protein product [Bursaphelenchus xylophilus]|uniref:Riboflavin transporter n=1 Tax=Bursaphelenchus xylophilus TaxID=6326 RepID=A0A1I7RIY0_BURXY|nr:unnamed protein product [Bursaphelenchus xylophilus]CAG9119168.1 unnamed protein product [Bursaphelenchus xylophilus]